MSDIRVAALDCELVVRAPEPAAGVFAEALAPLAVFQPRGGVLEQIEIRDEGELGWVMTADGVESRPMPSGRLLAHVLEHINRSAAESLVRELPLHAAAVAHPDGGAVALAGSSGAGKSTLGAAAVRSGWGFVAEEIAAIDADRQIRPYHRPIGLRGGGAAAIGMTIPDAEWFDSVYPWPVPTAARRYGGTLCGIALVTRVEGESAIELVRPALALAELVEHTVVPSPNGVVPAFRRLDELVRVVPVVRLSVGAPSDGVHLLDELVATWRR